MNKRIWAVLLSICIGVSLFTFNVSAYDNPSQCSLQVPGFGNLGLVDGLSFEQKSFTKNSATWQNISKLYVVNPKQNDYFQFCIYILSDWRNDTAERWPLVTSDGADGLESINNDDWIVVKRAVKKEITKLYTYYPGVNIENNSTYHDYITGIFFTVKYVGEDYSGTKSINLGARLNVLSLASFDLNARVLFTNVAITSDISVILHNILETENSLYSDLHHFLFDNEYGLWPYYYSLQERTSGYISDIRRKLTVLSTFDYISISYDNNGNVTTGTAKTTWYQALLNTINSLTMPFKAQVEREQQAKDAGAEDALDTAYDSVGSSFGALGDLSGLGSLATFDGDTLGSAGTGGLLSWFSQENANCIDAVPKNKAPDNIIDFYTGKIEKYNEEVGSENGSTDN